MRLTKMAVKAAYSPIFILYFCLVSQEDRKGVSAMCNQTQKSDRVRFSFPGETNNCLKRKSGVEFTLIKVIAGYCDAANPKMLYNYEL